MPLAFSSRKKTITGLHEYTASPNCTLHASPLSQYVYSYDSTAVDRVAYILDTHFVWVIICWARNVYVRSYIIWMYSVWLSHSYISSMPFSQIIVRQIQHAVRCWEHVWLIYSSPYRPKIWLLLNKCKWAVTRTARNFNIKAYSIYKTHFFWNILKAQNGTDVVKVNLKLIRASASLWSCCEFDCFNSFVAVLRG